MASPGSRFTVEVEKEQLIFSAAHFITFGHEPICESLHGHNYRVRCKVSGELNEHGYVVDFIALRDHLLQIVRQLDHRVLLPTQHPTIQVEITEGGEVQASFRERRWVFPRQDCLLLPIPNTTAEWLASWIADQLLQEMTELSKGINSLEVGVDENEGQWGSCLREIAE